MSLSQVLLEGRKDEFLSKYRDKFQPQDLKKIFLMSRELSSNQKFLNFLGKVISPNNVNEDLLKAKIAVEKFIKYQKNLDKKDINQYDSIKDINDAIERHENRVRRDVKEVEGADIVYEDDRFTVVTPKTHEASCYYGSGSKWCTAAKSSSQHFDRYNIDGKLFYFLDKKAPTSSRFYKVAMLQKYDGNQQYYDAPDKLFHKGWILGTPEFEKINKVIQNYLKTNYAEDIEIFKDEVRAKQEREIRRQRDERIRQERLLQQINDIRERDGWNLENDDLNELGRKANAVYEGLIDEWGVEIGDNESIYNLLPTTDNFYVGDILGFTWLGEDENDSEYMVGDWFHIFEQAKTNLQDTIEDVGFIESFNESFIMGYLDTDAVVEWFREYYDQNLRDEWEDIFDEEDLPLTKDQQSRLEKLEQEIEELYRRTRDTNSLPYSSDERGEVYDRIEELEGERDEIQENPEGEPTEEMIEEKISDYLYDVRQNPAAYLADYGLMDNADSFEQFIDKDSLIEDAIDTDGPGHFLSTYDGGLFSTTIEGVDYYVARVY